MKTLMCSLVPSKLDYCNSLLSGSTQYLIQLFQKVQNTAARITLKASRVEHTSPLLCFLHWLPIKKVIKHNVDKILQKEDVKILWNFKIQTDKHLTHNIPDINVVEKKQVWIIDVAIPGDGRIEEKELEKISKYQDQKIERERLWEKTSHCSTSSDRIIRCNTKRP